MKPYQFRLERVLRVRRLQEEILRASYFEARALADAARAIERAQAAELEGGRDALAQLQEASPLAPERVIAQQELLQRLDGVLARLSSDRERLEAVALRRADAAREARAGVRGLERLDERRRRAHATVVAQAEQAQADESAARRASGGPTLGTFASSTPAGSGGFSPGRAAVDELSSSASDQPPDPRQVSA